MSVERFTQVKLNPEELINSNKFYPRILLATAGSIGIGLDSPFPTSIFIMSQATG